MKQLWTGNNPVTLLILRSELDAKGIEFNVRNEVLRCGIGELPPIETWPEVWIVDEEKFADAQTILADVNSSDLTQQ